MTEDNKKEIQNGSVEEALNPNTTSAPGEAEPDSPTFSMQGVSGKVITGTVKVKKVKKAKRDDETSEAESAEDRAGDSEAVSQDEKSEASSSPAKVEVRPRKISSGAASPATAPAASQAPAKGAQTATGAQTAPEAQVAEARATQPTTAATTATSAASADAPTSAPAPAAAKTLDQAIDQAVEQAAVQAASETAARSSTVAGQQGVSTTESATASTDTQSAGASASASSAERRIDSKDQEPRPRKIGRMEPPQTSGKTSTQGQPQAKGPRKIASGQAGQAGQTGQAGQAHSGGRPGAQSGTGRGAQAQQAQQGTQQGAQARQGQTRPGQAKPGQSKPAESTPRQTGPRKIASAGAVESASAGASSGASAGQTTGASTGQTTGQTPGQARTQAPAGPRKISSGAAPAASGAPGTTGAPGTQGTPGTTGTPGTPGTPAAPTGPRKISSASADDSLAATARAFAKRKDEKAKAEAQGHGERTRYTGGRGRGTEGGSYQGRSGGGTGFQSRGAQGGSGYQGRSSQGGQGRAPFPGAGFDKDKDEDDKSKLHSGPRKPRAKKDVVADPNLARSQAAKNKFGANKDSKSTRSRDFAQTNKRSKNYMDSGEQTFVRGKRKTSQKDKDLRKEQSAVTHVTIPAFMTVKEFAEAISRTSADVIMHLMKNGIMATQNQEIDYDTASIIAEEFGVTTELLKEVELAEILFDDSEDEEENLVPRPPVVVVMGHVDHGKTTLLDRIRSASVATGEAGGITQRIGAYMTDVNGRKITFLDTPGHEAFTTMRARGAKATDIAILVVAADDGVMPQTIEAINHAKAANTEIIVAINKMDKPGANPDKVKQELTKYDLVPEEWGGSTVMVPISAKTGEGVNELLEMVLLTADVMDLRADPNKQAKGIIIEASLDKNRGTVATLLVQRGTLHQGDTIVANTVVGNIRAMRDANGIMNQPAGPSVPVEVIGLPEVPEAGAMFYVVEDERTARQFAEQRRIEERQAGIKNAPAVTLDNLFSSIEAGKVVDFNIIIKADVVGSVEAMKQSLEKLSNDEVRVNIIHGAAGAINESDLRLAEASSALVIGFNVRPTNAISELAKDLGVEIKYYDIIYKAIEDIELAMKGMLAPEYKEVILGHVEIRETYKVSSIGTIGGGYVTDGKIIRNCELRLLRDSVVVFTGRLGSLRRFKDDVKEVAAGYECGVTIENYNDLKVGDVIEAYQIQEVERE